VRKVLTDGQQLKRGAADCPLLLPGRRMSHPLIGRVGCRPLVVIAGLPNLGRDLGRFRDWRGCLRVPRPASALACPCPHAMLGLQVSRDGRVLVQAAVGGDLLPVPRSSVRASSRYTGNTVQVPASAGSVHARPCWCASLVGSAVMRRAGRTGFIGAAIGRCCGSRGRASS